jgi:hypothetical protein
MRYVKCRELQVDSLKLATYAMNKIKRNVCVFEVSVKRTPKELSRARGRNYLARLRARLVDGQGEAVCRRLKILKDRRHIEEEDDR